jgi:glycosyltransferase involved in cell wall biosynthesis
VAYRCGSVPEIIEDGVTGYIVGNELQAIDAVRRIDRIERAACRRAFESRFTACRMAQRYLDVYQALSAAAPTRPDAHADAKLLTWAPPQV